MIFNVFYTSNIPNFVIQDHQSCCKKLGIKVRYHESPYSDDFNVIYKAHGQLINHLLEAAEINEVICMLDIDCLPYSREDLESAYSWAKINESFIGNAQNISHTSYKNRIFAAASMLMIHKKSWLTLGKPDLSYAMSGSDDSLIDTAQSISLAADEVGYPYRVLLPLGYDDHKSSWQLGPFCSYGRGTTYPGTWHLFRISDLINNPPKIWSQRVNEIINGKEIKPVHNSLNNHFEKFLPLSKRVKKKFKQIFKKFKSKLS